MPTACFSNDRIPSESGFGCGGISPRVPFHRREEFLGVRHALQYYTCCQSVMRIWIPESGSLRQQPAVWSISVWTG